MGRRLPSPYEYLGATEEELKVILSLLDDKDKELFYERYGKDLHNPVSSKTFNVIKANNYYSDLAPRMRDILEKIRNYHKFQIRCRKFPMKCIIHLSFQTLQFVNITRSFPLKFSVVRRALNF